MSLLATFPELRAWERRHDSLIRGARAALKGVPKTAAKPMFATLWSGLGRLVGSLEEAIGEERIWLGTWADSLTMSDGRYRVGSSGGPIDADAVVLATPAAAAAHIVRQLDERVARELDAIPYASTAVVFLVYPAGELPDATGFVVPIRDRVITACTFLSRKWPRDDFGRRVVLRCFVGRAGQEDPLALSDAELSAAAAAEVEEGLRLAGPPTTKVVRWPSSMPQYEVGHLDRLSRIERHLQERPGLFLAGSAYGGVGIADCIRQGNEAAGRVGSFLERRRGVASEGAPEERKETVSWRK
jgi:oxygen-dependent protoporphyrinogen oxidase